MGNTIDGRNPVFKGKRIEDLTSEEEFIKYGVTLGEGTKRGISLIENMGRDRAFEYALKQKDTQEIREVSIPQASKEDIGKMAKYIASKLMKNVELTQEEAAFITEYEEEVNKELE